MPDDRSFLARYGAVIAGDGVATVPRALFRYQRELGLSPQHTWFIATILSHKWTRDLPRPSISGLAERTGVSRSQLHRYERELVDLGWLAVVNRYNGAGGQIANAFDFSALFARLEEFILRDAGKPDDDDDSGPEGVAATQQRGVAPVRQGGVSPARQGTVAPVRHEEETGHEEAIGEETSNIERSDSSRSARDDPDRETLSAYISDVAAELGDRARLSASITRAIRIYRKSGQDLEAFIELLFRAKSLTREHQASIRTGERKPGQPRSVMHYWFAVLEDLARQDGVP